VHGTPNIARLADRVYEQTQHQLRGFDRPPYSRVPGTGYRMERSRLAAGVAYRVIYDGDALAIPGRMYDDILPSASTAAVGQPGASHGAPDAETAALLAMLAAGMTDASIARSLSWSMRTTQRRMRQLMNDLGATSRFQAGVAAREKGWL
jgi:DNA-binding CsgD family transcriptional regulator